MLDWPPDANDLESFYPAFAFTMKCYQRNFLHLRTSLRPEVVCYWRLHQAPYTGSNVPPVRARAANRIMSGTDASRVPIDYGKALPGPHPV